MNIIIGTSLLILVLAIFTLFNYKAPYGTKAMGALASAACASFLVEAFQDSFFGKVLGFQFLSEVGGANGSLSGVAAAILVTIAIGVTPGYAVLIGLSVSGTGIIPGFLAGYLVGFLVKWMERNIPGGLDLISIIIIGAPLTRLVAKLLTPLINSTLLTIGDILTSGAHSNPIPIYVTNFVGGAACGILIALMKLVNDTPGTATPIAGFAVMFAYNPMIKVLITALGCIILSLLAGYFGGIVFKDYKLVTKEELQARDN